MDYSLRQDIDKKLQGEIGTIYKTSHGKIAIALIYPNTYYVGMSNLGFQTIYGFLNEQETVCCERAFLPERHLLTRYERTHTLLCSLESKTILSEFDILAFSVSFENDYLNILKILELSGIPLKAEERKGRIPLILVGGAITAINPEPLADFVDVCILGDGEPILSKLIDAYQHFAGVQSKQEFLEHLAYIPGVYVPSFYNIEYKASGQIQQIVPKANVPQTIGKCPIDDLDRYPAYSRILTEQTEFGKMFLLQINRGCAYQCRFCHTGYTQSPLRHLSLEVALRLIEEGLQLRDTIGLVGAAIADYPYLREICDGIVSRRGKLSVSSLRLSALGKTDYLVDALVRAGQKTITMAPEAGTERLRKMIRKGLSDTLFYETVEAIIDEHLPNLKLYFLIGLPTETNDDIDAIVEVCKQCKDLMLKTAKVQGTIGKLTISVNPFVPKPFTPLQWCPMAPEGEIKRKLQRIKRGLHRVGNVEVIHELPKWAIWQGILARGDRRLGQVLLQTLANQGNWKKAFQTLHLVPDFYSHRTRDPHEKFPWNHLNVGLSHQHLLDEYQRIFDVENQ